MHRRRFPCANTPADPRFIPIFIGGCSRSGTTMLGSMLGGSHEAICTPESQFLDLLLDAIEDGHEGLVLALNTFPQNFRYRLWKTGTPPALEADLSPKQAVVRIMEELITRVAAAQGRTSVRFWVDHTPSNIHRAARLVDVFPHARIIHLVRDGRAVAASWRDITWGPRTPRKQARTWQVELAAGFAMETLLGPDRIMRVRYEDILSEPPTVLQDIARFTTLPWDDTMVVGGRFEAIPSYTRSQHKLVGKPPDPDRAHAWMRKLPVRHIELFEHYARSTLIGLGYTLMHPQPSRPTRIERITHPVLEFVMRYARILRNTLQRRRLTP